MSNLSAGGSDGFLGLKRMSTVKSSIVDFKVQQQPHQLQSQRAVWTFRVIILLGMETQQEAGQWKSSGLQEFVYLMVYLAPDDACDEVSRYHRQLEGQTWQSLGRLNNIGGRLGVTVSFDNLRVGQAEQHRLRFALFVTSANAVKLLARTKPEPVTAHAADQISGIKAKNGNEARSSSLTSFYQRHASPLWDEEIPADGLDEWTVESDAESDVP